MKLPGHRISTSYKLQYSTWIYRKTSLSRPMTRSSETIYLPAQTFYSSLSRLIEVLDELKVWSMNVIVIFGLELIEAHEAAYRQSRGG